MRRMQPGGEAVRLAGSRRRRQVHWSGLFGALLLGMAIGSVAGADPAAEAQAVVADPDYVYSTAFTWACPPDLWEKVLDEPLLMGRLWEAYGYAPAYRFSARGEVIHVDDPTGLQGDAVLVSRGPGSRTYLVQGKVDHWAVPFFNEGLAVFVLSSRPAGDQVVVDLKVHVSAGSTVGSLVLAVGRPLLARHIDNRVTLNLQDGRRIVETLAARPQEAAGLLGGEDGARFRAKFGG